MLLVSFFKVMLSRKRRLSKLNLTVREISDGTSRSRKVPLKKYKEINQQQTNPDTSRPFIQAPLGDQQELQDQPPAPEQPLEEPLVVSESSKWQEIQQDLLDVFFEDVPEGTLCVQCYGPLGDEHVKCEDCGVGAYFCSRECCMCVHVWNLNPFHKPLKLKVSIRVSCYNTIK